MGIEIRSWLIGGNKHYHFSLPALCRQILLSSWKMLSYVEASDLQVGTGNVGSLGCC